MNTASQAWMLRTFARPLNSFPLWCAVPTAWLLTKSVPSKVLALSSTAVGHVRKNTLNNKRKDALNSMLCGGLDVFLLFEK